MAASERPEVRSDGTIVLRQPAGVLAFRRIGRVLFVANRGVLEKAGMEAMLAQADQIQAEGMTPLVVSHSAALQEFTPEARKELADWVRHLRPKARSIVLVRSKILKMVFSVLSMLGGAELEMFDDEAKFDAAVTGALPAGVKNPHVERELG